MSDPLIWSFDSSQKLKPGDLELRKAKEEAGAGFSPAVCITQQTLARCFGSQVC